MKRVLRDIENFHSNNELPEKRQKDESITTKCAHCAQNLEKIIFYNGHPNNSVEESIALTSETLSIFGGDEENLPETDNRPIHKLTGYCVYDEKGHLTPFDTGLVEQNVVLHLSGYLKPIYNEDPSINNGIAAHDLGPINAWYIAGFDGGENTCVGVLTSYAEYLLMEPSPEYLPIVTSFLKKITFLKIIIEYLLDYGVENPTYDDLLYHLQIYGEEDFNEEFLLQNAYFICKQVYSFENAAPAEEALMAIPCMQTLIELSGIVFANIKTHNLKKSIVRRPDRKATTTKLVRSVFESFFLDNVKGEKLIKKKRCGICEQCQIPDCGLCPNCKDMPKFGGPGKSKQACKLRRCANMEIDEADDTLTENIDVIATNYNLKEAILINFKKVEWPGKPFKIVAEKIFYSSVTIGDELLVEPNDYVMLHSDAANKPLIIVKVVSIFSKHNQPTFHGQILCWGIHTILGETADPQELFLINLCEDIPLGAIIKKANVIFKDKYEDFDKLESESVHVSIEDSTCFYFSKRYDKETARFTNCVEANFSAECFCCRERCEENKFLDKQLIDNSIHWKGEVYKKGSAVFLKPSTFNFSQNSSQDHIEINKSINEEDYPEYYRKFLDLNPGSEKITEPFCIGLIEDISLNKCQTIKIKVRKFYRFKNTEKSNVNAYDNDLNLVFWSEEVLSISFDNVIGKCFLRFCDSSEAETWSSKGPYRFYFNKGYNFKISKFYELSTTALKSLGINAKGKGKKENILLAPKLEKSSDWDRIDRPLKCLDIFAGCGGLSLGLHQAGVIETQWAVDNMSKAAEAFKINNPQTKIFVEDCNKILKDVMSGIGSNDLPKKGDVEIIVGGPPCQGFSNMNRFSARQYSFLKNSLIATFLSFCDYYRPKYCVLENVRNFAAFRHSIVLKLTIKCLLAMNYQVSFGILQAANYGIPQTRRRFFLIAAAPGFVLPKFPMPNHVFEKKDYHLSITVNGVKYYKDNVWEESAPYRAICVRDAISDLPSIPNGHNKAVMLYDEEAISHFQRTIRGNCEVLYDHICKDMAPIVEARISRIPQTPGSDWRDLPNICVKLKDDSTTNKLQYRYFSKKQKQMDRPRGVCQCSSGKSCNPSDRQTNTLIPWCLPHTADRNNNWAGLYGRLGWDEVFRTTVTNPEPIGKQGKVIHPEQNRVVSVRECARSQGFPDHFRFVGNILDKHRQIGNAVPPPLAKALGFELRKALASSQK